MGYFSNNFAKIVEEYGSSKAVAAATGLGASTISRFMNDLMVPDVESIGRICRALPDDLAAGVLESYLLDHVPADQRHLVRIEAIRAMVQEAPFERPSAYNNLKPRSRAMIDELSRLCLEDEEVAETFTRTIKLLSPAWAKHVS